jgi:LPXTG-motif cell wall-anchored protein
VGYFSEVKVYVRYSNEQIAWVWVQFRESKTIQFVAAMSGTYEVEVYGSNLGELIGPFASGGNDYKLEINVSYDSAALIPAPGMPSATPTPTSMPTPTPTATPTPTPTPSTLWDQRTGSDSWIWIAMVAIVIIGVVVSAVAFKRRKKKTTTVNPQVYEYLQPPPPPPP